MPKSFDLIIRNADVVLEQEVRRLDIGIAGGVIAELGERLPEEGEQELDASGKLVMPGMVDAHVHLNEPGRGDWEGFRTGSAALAAGGCTAYIDMPLNGFPPTTRASALKMKKELAASNSYTDYAFWGGLVPGNLDDLLPLAEEGAVAFKAFMSATGIEGEDEFREVDDLTLIRGMERISELGKVLALHAESETITSALREEKLKAGEVTAYDYEASRPVMAEVEAVSRALLYAKYTGCALHFVHISSPQAVEIIDQAKREGQDVTLETCPHYLVLTVDDLDRIGADAKCAPPLRSKEVSEGLWRLLAEGKIDMVTSDHSPCPTSWKRKGSGLFEAWGGISGAQSSLELMLDEGHLKRDIPLPVLARALSVAPARRFGLSGRKKGISIGADADLVLVNLSSGYRLEAEDLYYRHRHSPYVGRDFNCRVEGTLVRGQWVYRLGPDGGIFGQPAGVCLSLFDKPAP